ncbi:hypothetical protein PUNSTDRAFT_54084 [Punctularia strigosozonata HHB-11173 SS5]|uniref:uncharacterized protein n=1 Tax=Punctularia strigosozonata (strain HHB-11173) TaxID=741275 RepID=UPI00044182CE|nr:uncharacterized protein PUNSTDRAFT_54084 [Punctularia strigosozonata HHB-11173 SS5]EIN06670.1 hypothetical protein PUNSTDRAFT_54084 [Punctularia strigosozonata HHB-11173 SS5]
MEQGVIASRAPCDTSPIVVISLFSKALWDQGTLTWHKGVGLMYRDDACSDSDPS